METENGYVRGEEKETILPKQKGKQGKPKHKGKHDKPKSSWNEIGKFEVSFFSTLFPRYLEKYLQECWHQVESALKEYEVACELNLVGGSMKVTTTRKTRDPNIIIKARDLIKLLSRSVPVDQAIKILNDEMQCDIIKIGDLVRSKNRFIELRELFVGQNSANLKALEILSGCYILVQGKTVSAMGTFKGLKKVRKAVEDCMLKKQHPIFTNKILTLKGELAKKKKYVKQKKVKSEEKKAIDQQLESGEDDTKKAKKRLEKQGKQAENIAKNKRKLEEAFVPPEESMKPDSGASTNERNDDVAAMASSVMEKAKEFVKKIDLEALIATAGKPSKKKKSKHS